MPVPEETVRRVAGLACLELSDDEVARLAGDLSRILEYVEMLEDAPRAQPFSRGRSGRLRPDAVGETLNSREALRNAPSVSEGFFKVPRFLPED